MTVKIVGYHNIKLGRNIICGCECYCYIEIDKIIWYDGCINGKIIKEWNLPNKK